MADPEAGMSEEAAGDTRAFETLVLRARLALFWEQAWPRLAVPVGVIGLFVALSWFDLFGVLAGLPRLALFLVFFAGLLASLWPLARLRFPSRDMALHRIDEAIGLPHRPATTRQDRLVQGGGDPLAEALWRRHLRLALEASRRVSLGLPSPGLPQLDRYGLRVGAILALFVGFFYAGAERLPRLIDALASPRHDIAALFSGQDGELSGMRMDAWVTPPPYTRRAPQVLSQANQGAPIPVPQGSVLVVRLAGDKGAEIAAQAGTEDVPSSTPADQEAAVVEKRLKLMSDTGIDIRHGDGSLTRFAFTVIPDRPPTIAFEGPVKPDGKGGMIFSYKIDDDYGATAVESQSTLLSDGHPLYQPPKIALSAPAGHARSGTVTATRNLSADPLAGATVKMTLVVRDDAGNEGRSEPQDVTLPQREFQNPLARALVEQRLTLALDANQAREVKYALEALMIAPEDFTKDAGLYLGLRTVRDRIDRANSDDAYRDAADYLWQIALAIEEGDGSVAERRLRAAREKLKEALERGASPEEIEKLTQELRQALNDFLQDYAKRQQQALKNTQKPGDKPVRNITPEELNKLLDQLENSAKNGKKDDAQKLLSQLDDILNNLANPEDSVGQGDPTMQQMQQSLNDMGKMILRQQRLRDQTYRQNQPFGQGQEGQGQEGQGQDGQGPGDQGMGDQGLGDQGLGDQGQGGQGQGPSGQGRQGQNGQGPGSTGQGGQGQGGQGEASPSLDQLKERQQALRQQLEKMQKNLRDSGAETPGALGEAGQAMRDAENQLGEQDGENAVNSQGRAIEALRKAAKGLAEQMAQARKNGKGPQQGNNRGGKDPLGRQLPNGPDFSADGSTEASPSRRAGEVLNELRRRLADPNRPKAETDYLERLLNRQ
ncbi:TIGR02302 family protein [Labrys okinawensis]|uniref:TIGR02302 family protein n=1 Tax=Labrys okinawensis TaxID=346911 RepID=A0A2S9Q7U1_9HYPH|nr:TIGR02302 family protein [Labrys okinawensis]PRH85422.1 TIGR02302 family protein [Labrys okinawensis]